jgi:hypothetical protein
MLVAAPTPVADPVTTATLFDDALILINKLPFLLLSYVVSRGDLPTEAMPLSRASASSFGS